jgi:hypothetical protein
MAKNRQANRRAGSLGHDGVYSVRQALLAVTASKIYGFNSKPKGRKGWQIVDQVAEWDRSDVRVSFDDQRVTRTVTLEIISTGDRHELRWSRWPERSTIPSSPRSRPRHRPPVLSGSEPRAETVLATRPRQADP